MFDNNPVVQVIMVHIRLHNSKLVLKWVYAMPHAYSTHLIKLSQLCMQGQEGEFDSS